MKNYNQQIVEEAGSSQVEGTFCGQMPDTYTFLSPAKSVTLYSNSGSKFDHFNAFYDILSMETARRRYPEMKRLTDGEAVPGTWCDLVVHNCASTCRISSPYYPSFYQRNITCRYQITFDKADKQVVIGGQPGDRYEVGLQSECDHDRIVVYERALNEIKEIGKFCGRGKFPRVDQQKLS